jgi:hypothetical protein
MKVQPDLFEESKVVIDFVIGQWLFLNADLPQILIFTEFSSKSFEALYLKSDELSLARQAMANELRRYRRRGAHNRADKATQ